MILINYSNGRMLQGIVLSFGTQVMRAAIKDSDDVAEFRLIHNVWVSEDCEVVRFDFAEHASRLDIQGDDFLEAMLSAGAALSPVQRLM